MGRIRSKMHLLVFRNVYVHCTDILTIFYLVYKAIKALIDGIQNRSNEAYPPDIYRPVRFLIYIDESHEMTTDTKILRDDGHIAYQICALA